MSVHLAKRQYRLLPKACALPSHRLLSRSNHSFWSMFRNKSAVKAHRATGINIRDSFCIRGFFEIGSQVAGADLELLTPLLLCIKKAWDDRYVPPCLVYMASVPYIYCTLPTQSLRIWDFLGGHCMLSNLSLRQIFAYFHIRVCHIGLWPTVSGAGPLSTQQNGVLLSPRFYFSGGILFLPQNREIVHLHYSRH